MKHTAKQRKAIAAAFRAAKPYLLTGSEHIRVPGVSSYICFALDEACRGGHIDHKTLMKTIGVVEQRLAPRDCVRSWLALEVNTPKHLLTNQNVQQYRHRWLHALIKEFES